MLSPFLLPQIELMTHRLVHIARPKTKLSPYNTCHFEDFKVELDIFFTSLTLQPLYRNSSEI